MIGHGVEFMLMTREIYSTFKTLSQKVDVVGIGRGKEFESILIYEETILM